MRIAIGIPFRSNEVFLLEAIAALRSQVYSDWNAVVLDDSDDGILHETKQFIESDQRIRLVRSSSPGKGIGVAWNSALQEVIESIKPDAVALLHADDIPGTQFLARLVRVLELNPKVDAVSCRAKTIDSSGDSSLHIADLAKRLLAPSHNCRTVDYSGDEGLARILRTNVIICPTLLYRTRCFDRQRFDQSLRMALDLHFLSRALLDGMVIRSIPEVLYQYRRHAGSQTSTLMRSKQRFEEELLVYRELKVICKEKGWTRSAQVAGHALTIRLYRLIEKVMRG